MSKHHYTLFTFMAVLFIYGNLFSQWISNSGPYNANIQCLAYKENVLFAGTQAGIFTSTNNGANWILVSSLENSEVISLAVYDSLIFAGTYYNGVYISLDNGQSWTTMNTGLELSNIPKLLILGDNLFAATGGGIYKTRIGTLTWNQSSLKNRIVNIGTDGKNIYAIGNGMYVSKDSGETWEQIITPHIFNGTLAVNDSRIFAGTNDVGLYISTDKGINWIVKTFIAVMPLISSLTTNGQNIFVGLETGITASFDNGDNWSNIGTQIPQCFAFRDTTIIVGTYYGAYRSAKYGGLWNEINTGLTNTDIYSLFIDGSNIFAGTNGYVYLSTNSGTSWESILNNSSKNYSIVQTDTSIIVASNNGIYLTTNNGINWAHSGVGGNDCLSLAISGNYIFTGTGSGIYRSSNGGSNWSRLNYGNYDKIVRSLLVLGNNIFAGTWGSGMVISTDNGNSWNEINNGLINYSIWGLVSRDTNIYAGTWGGVFVSSNNGKNWTAVNTGLTDTVVYCLAIKGDMIFAGTKSGVFMTSNGGSQWSDVSNSLPVPSKWSIAWCLTTDESNLYLGTTIHGLWKRTLSQLMYTIPEGNNPSTSLQYALSQNYPNPFNSSTKIKYSINNSGLVQIMIFDILGRKVKTLLDENKLSGSYEIVFEADDLPSGIYLYKIISENKSIVRKMLLIK